MSDSQVFLDTNYVAPSIPLISIDDLTRSYQSLKKKEDDDKLLLESIASVPQEELKNKLVVWAGLGFPPHYEIYRIEVIPPIICSDGVVRSIFDYIKFCSGKLINEHTDSLQSKVTGIRVADMYLGGNTICVVVSKV